MADYYRTIMQSEDSLTSLVVKSPQINFLLSVAPQSFDPGRVCKTIFQPSIPMVTATDCFPHLQPPGGQK